MSKRETLFQQKPKLIIISLLFNWNGINHEQSSSKNWTASQIFLLRTRCWVSLVNSFTFELLKLLEQESFIKNDNCSLFFNFCLCCLCLSVCLPLIVWVKVYLIMIFKKRRKIFLRSLFHTSLILYLLVSLCADIFYWSICQFIIIFLSMSI